MEGTANNRIPMCGLPFALETLLVSLSDAMEIKNWSIFSEKNGGCCVKIRWLPPQTGDIMSGVQGQQRNNLKYKKKSPGAVSRDNQRSADYHRTIQTRSMTNPKTQEVPRAKDNVDDVASIQSPILIESASPSEEMDTTPVIDTGEKQELSSSELRSVNCKLNFDESTFQCGSHTSTLTMSPIKDCGHVSEACLQSDSEPESDTDQPPDCECPSAYCCYGDSGGVKNSFRYICKKCSSARSRLSVCATCYASGGHSNHRKYLVPYDSDSNT